MLQIIFLILKLVDDIKSEDIIIKILTQLKVSVPLLFCFYIYNVNP